MGGRLTIHQHAFPADILASPKDIHGEVIGNWYIVGPNDIRAVVSKSIFKERLDEPLVGRCLFCKIPDGDGFDTRIFGKVTGNHGDDKVLVAMTPELLDRWRDWLDG